MRRWWLFLLILSVGAAAPAQNAVEITAEPSHHLVLENPYVRVFSVEIAPHASTLVHSHHHDYFWVAIGAADVTSTVTGKPPQQTKVQDGETRFTPGNFAHKATNNAATPFRNVTIEVLKPGKLTATPESRGLELDHGLAVDTVMVKDGIRVRDVILQPGASLPQHTHKGPHLVIAVTARDMKATSARGSREVHQKPGESEWVPANTTHSITNIGKAPARYITFDFE